MLAAIVRRHLSHDMSMDAGSSLYFALHTCSYGSNTISSLD